MKILFTFVGAILFIGSTFSQNFSLALYNKSFTSCATFYEELDVLASSEAYKGDKYLVDGKEYTGCAKGSWRDHTGKLLDYRISEIENGYATKILHYFSDGTLSREVNLEDGLWDGKHIMNFENGKPYIEEHFKEGKRHGSTKRWNDKGEMGRNALFENGIPVYDHVYFKDDNC